MGYKYHLQFDDDAMLNGTSMHTHWLFKYMYIHTCITTGALKYDVVTKLRNSSISMGVFSDSIGEVIYLCSSMIAGYDGMSIFMH